MKDSFQFTATGESGGKQLNGSGGGGPRAWRCAVEDKENKPSSELQRHLGKILDSSWMNQLKKGVKLRQNKSG